MNLIESNLQVLHDLKIFLQQIDHETYTEKSELFFNASIGQHCRHIIEFYQCLIGQMSDAFVCYDKRQRQMLLEESSAAAEASLIAVIDWLETEPQDKRMQLSFCHSKDSETEISYIDSSIYRELAFNIEHAIHHMAIIKIAAKILNPEIKIPAHFGVAPSTLRHYKQQKPSAAG
jgi:uncharacterized damage-inducible protein DinB